MANKIDRIKFEDILAKAQIRNRLDISHIHGSHYWTIEGKFYRVSDHDSKKDTYKYGVNDFRSYDEFYNQLKKTHDLSDKTTVEKIYKQKAAKHIIKKADDDYMQPDGTRWGSLEAALNNMWRYKKQIPKSLKNNVKQSLKGINMITKSNIIEEYPKIKVDLPKALDKSEFEFVKENLDLYDDDEGIAEYIDTFISKLNEVLAKAKVEPVKQDKPAPKAPPKKTPTPKKPKAPKAPKSPPKKKTTTKRKPAAKNPKAPAKAKSAIKNPKSAIKKAPAKRKSAIRNPKSAIIKDREGNVIGESTFLFTLKSLAMRQAKKLKMKAYSMPDNIHYFVCKNMKEAMAKAKLYKPKFRLKVHSLSGLSADNLSDFAVVQHFVGLMRTQFTLEQLREFKRMLNIYPSNPEDHYYPEIEAIRTKTDQLIEQAEKSGLTKFKVTDATGFVAECESKIYQPVEIEFPLKKA